jgi:fructose-1,6-bisphosphatase/inositol monophosphatase family enzyme
VHPWLWGWEYIFTSAIGQHIIIKAMIILHFHLQIIKDGIARTKNVNTKLGSWDLVTQYDKWVEEVLVTRISEKFPSHK